MLYELVKFHKGQEEVVMRDELVKINKRLRTIRGSQRRGIKRQRVSYGIRPSTETAKFQKPPHNYNIGGSGAQIPRVQKQ